MIIRCSYCGQKNRLQSNIRTPGIYSCQQCKQQLVEIKLTFHHGFLFAAIEELQAVENEISSINFDYLAQSKLNDLYSRARRANTKLELWKNSVARLPPDEVLLLNRSYALVLMEASEIFIRIEEAIESKRVYKKLNTFLRQVQAALVPVVGVLNIILPWLGLNPIKFNTKLLNE